MKNLYFCSKYIDNEYIFLMCGKIKTNILDSERNKGISIDHRLCNDLLVLKLFLFLTYFYFWRVILVD